MEKNKLILTEILIIVLILLALVLPKLIGQTEVESFDGYINGIDTLNGHDIGMDGNLDEDELFAEFFPDSKCLEYELVDDGVKDILDKKVDAFVCKLEDALKIAKDNEKLLIYQLPLISKFSTDANKDSLLYLIIREEDLAYNPTKKTLDGILEPGIKVACLTGMVEGELLKEMNPDCIIEYYDNYIDIFNAVSKGKADYCFGFDDNIASILPSFNNIAAIPEPFAVMNECFALSKTERGETLLKEFDSFLYELQKSGQYEKINSKWKSGKKENYILEEVNFTGEKGVIKISTPGTWMPNTFFYNNEITGAFIDICNLFCEKNGYIPEYEISVFAGEIAGLSTGEYDLMADLCEDTEERKEVVNFTRPAFISACMMFTQADYASIKNVSKSSVFFKSIQEKFYKNFIEQDRYKMVLQGLWTTIRISILASVMGTLLGAIICLMRKSKKIFFNAFSRIYIKVVQGTPIVVLLLILYYIVFANSSVTGFWVSVIGFTIDFSAYVAEIFRSGIDAIPEGQGLAARALGFSPFQSFVKVVFPQALINIVPVYSGQFISLIKATSIVGYIAVQDLTKMSDLIRGTTYEAFFPLISTAVIYFIISTLLIQIIKGITNKMDPLKKSRMPKGVKTNAI